MQINKQKDYHKILLYIYTYLCVQFVLHINMYVLRVLSTVAVSRSIDNISY